MSEKSTINYREETAEENGVYHFGEAPAACVQEEPKNIFLPLQTVLADRYTIEKVLGQGGLGITYLAHDAKEDRKVVIKECYMHDLMKGRSEEDGKTPLPYDEDEAEVFESMKQDMKEGWTVATKVYGVPGTIATKQVFEENGTVYNVTDYVEGVSLQEILAGREEPMKADELLTLLKPCMGGLAEVHKAGIIHRNVSTGNILVPKDGSPACIIDFDIAHTWSMENEEIPVYKKGSYTPIEQQSRRGEQGPWTDVYALCVTIYIALTGVRPPEAVDRIAEDRLSAPSSLGIEITPQIEAALMQGLAVKSKERIRSVEELAERFGLYK